MGINLPDPRNSQHFLFYMIIDNYQHTIVIRDIIAVSQSEVRCST